MVNLNWRCQHGRRLILPERGDAYGPLGRTVPVLSCGHRRFVSGDPDAQKEIAATAQGFGYFSRILRVSRLLGNASSMLIIYWRRDFVYTFSLFWRLVCGSTHGGARVEMAISLSSEKESHLIKFMLLLDCRYGIILPCPKHLVWQKCGKRYLEIEKTYMYQRLAASYSLICNKQVAGSSPIVGSIFS